jgi:hypothetical protein
MGPAFRTTCQDAVANTAWQVITTYSRRYHGELKNTVYYLLPQRKKNEFKVSGVKADVPKMLMVHHQDVFVEMSTRLPSRRSRNSVTSSGIRMRLLECSRGWLLVKPVTSIHLTPTLGQPPPQDLEQRMS